MCGADNVTAWAGSGRFGGESGALHKNLATRYGLGLTVFGSVVKVAQTPARFVWGMLMKRHARRFLFLSVLLWLYTLLAPVPLASAEIAGNCEATFKNVPIKDLKTDSAGDAIDVDDNEIVVVTFASAVGFASHSVDLEIAGQSRSVGSGTDDGDTTFSEDVNVKDYAYLGAGLYTVVGTATLTDGSTCSGKALINVKRFPLTTVTGGVAAGATALGLMAVVASVGVTASAGARASGKIEDWVGNELEKQARQPETPAKPEWTIVDEILYMLGGPFGPCFMMALPALVLTIGAMVTPQGGAPLGGPTRRARWTPRVTIAGVLGGLLAGVGAAVLLQQFAVQVLTVTLLIECAVGGLIIGILLPSLAKLWSVLRVNAAIRSAQKRLAAAAPRTSGPPPSTHPESGA